MSSSPIGPVIVLNCPFYLSVHKACHVDLPTQLVVGERSGGATLGVQLLLWHKRNYLIAGAALSLFRGLKDRFDIETVLGGFVLANAPDFIDMGSLAMTYSPI